MVAGRELSCCSRRRFGVGATPKEAGMLQFSVQNNQVLDGYAAFNAGDWDAVKAMFCPDFTEGGNDFPVWHPHPMHGSATAITGRQAIVNHLQQLWGNGTRARLLATASQGASLIALDFTSGGVEGPHACADKIVFSESGCIKEVWHCSSGTHEHGGHAGHEAPHAHP
jgi:hypothetical protein